MDFEMSHLHHHHQHHLMDSRGDTLCYDCGETCVCVGCLSKFYNDYTTTVDDDICNDCVDPVRCHYCSYIYQIEHAWGTNLTTTTRM